MRFQTFEFQQYAGFEKRSLKFDETKRLHIILGNNEAGKSRLLRAFGRFFFGFPHRGDPDQFGVIGSKSKLVAHIKLGDKTGLFERSRSKSTPFASHSTDVSVEALLQELGGLGEKQFLNLHALSHDELRQGGTDLMGGKGSLGKSLFAAGAGLLPIQQRILGYQKAAEELFLPRANAKKEINQLLVERAELQAILKESEFNQQKFAELSGKINRAKMNEAETLSASNKLRSVLGQVRTASELRASLEFKTRELGDLKTLTSTKNDELNTFLEMLGLKELWLKQVSPSLMPVLLQMAKKLDDTTNELNAILKSMGPAPSLNQDISELDVGELTDLPDIENQQHQIDKLENQAAAHRTKAQLLAEQLGLPDLETLETPMPHELRDLQDKMRDLIQEARGLDKTSEAIEAELRELTNRQNRLKQTTPEIDEEFFNQQMKLRDRTLREAINLLVAEEKSKAVAKITEAQTLIDNLDQMSKHRLLKADDVAQVAMLSEALGSAYAKQSSMMDEQKNCSNRKAEIAEYWRQKWNEFGLSEVSMRSYAEWQKMADTWFELKRQLKQIDFDLLDHRSELKRSEERVIELYSHWQKVLEIKLDKQTVAGKRQQLNLWASEIQSKQAELKSYASLCAQADKATLNQQQALQTLNQELVLVGLTKQTSAATAVQFVGQLENLLHIKTSLDGLRAKSLGLGEEVASIDQKLMTLGLEDLGEAADIQRESDAAKDKHLLAAQELSELNVELERHWRSNDPLILESQIKVLEEKIGQKVHAYKLNKAAAHVLDMGLERFVKQQGQDLLSRASEHIQALTNGRYKEIRVDGVGEDSHWNVINDLGEEVPSTGLSDGTRDQLFLSMRLSFLSESKLPFIADDLFVNFDDQRSEAAFARLESALPDSQLFYFTHHRHLAEVAMRAIGKQKVELVELG